MNKYDQNLQKAMVKHMNQTGTDIHEIPVEKKVEEVKTDEVIEEQIAQTHQD